MFKIITTQPLVGQELKLSDENVKNWDELSSLITDNEKYQISIMHNNKIHLGEMIRFTEGKVVRYAMLMDRSVVLPEGVCIKVEINVEPNDECQACCVDTEYNLTNDTRFAVLDSSGCIGGYVTLSDIISHIEIPTLCDLLPTPDERNGNLVAQDRILTISGNCNIKAVKQSDLKCK